MTAFQAAVDATFAAFGIDAVYTPADGDPVGVRVIARRPDTFVVQGEPERRDPDRLVWSLDTRRA
jgi:hypothetical protein